LYPQSVRESIADLESRLTPDQIGAIADFPSAEDFVGAVHMTLGMFIRNSHGCYDNNWALFREVRVLRPELEHVLPDDVSETILTIFHRKVHAQAQAGA
jgi:hypothetical protein